jgi:hypothetical protein
LQVKHFDRLGGIGEYAGATYRYARRFGISMIAISNGHEISSGIFYTRKAKIIKIERLIMFSCLGGVCYIINLGIFI